MVEKERNAPLWVKILVMVHVVLITSWAVPTPATGILARKQDPNGVEAVLLLNYDYIRAEFSGMPPDERPKLPQRYYVFGAGVWQNWNMFAPNPANIDNWCDAEVVFADGTVKRHQYPRINKLPIPEKYIKERYRKYYEYAFQDQYEWLWPAFAQRIALENYTDPDNPPTLVRLYRHYISVPPTMSFPEYISGLWKAITSGAVTAEVLSPPNPKMPAEYESANYFNWEVDQQKLRKDAAR